MSNQCMSTFWGESVSIPAGEYTSGCERCSKANFKREDVHDSLFQFFGGFAKTNCYAFSSRVESTGHLRKNLNSLAASHLIKAHSVYQIEQNDVMQVSRCD